MSKKKNKFNFVACKTDAMVMCGYWSTWKEDNSKISVKKKLNLIPGTTISAMKLYKFTYSAIHRSQDSDGLNFW